MKRAMIAVVLATSCAPQRSAKPLPLVCEHGIDPETEDCRPGPNDIVPVAAPRRDHVMKTETAADSFEVRAVPAGAVGWRLTVVNHGDTPAMVLLAESSFVTSDGRSLGRLVARSSGGPIAVGAHWTDVVIAEQLVDQEGFEAKLQREGARAVLAPKIAQARAARERAIVGGRLHVVVANERGKQTWSGVVVATAAGDE